MKVTHFLFCCLACISCTAQKQNYNRQIDKIKQIKSMPYMPELSGDKQFWDLTKGKKSIIPYLIDRISDTTLTKAHVPNFGLDYRVGDVCVVAISKIVHGFPLLKLITTDDALLSEGGTIYWDYVRPYKGRLEYQRRVREWYRNNESNLIWTQDDNLYGVDDNENGLIKKLPAGGFYVVKDAEQ